MLRLLWQAAHPVIRRRRAVWQEMLFDCPNAMPRPAQAAPGFSTERNQIMHRRSFLSRSLTCSALAIFAGSAMAAPNTPPAAKPLPQRKRIRVAFMLGKGSNVIDTAGPWEVFQDVTIKGLLVDSEPFELFTVGPTKDLLTMTGGLQVQPHYSIDNAPQPHVIVV